MTVTHQVTVAPPADNSGLLAQIETVFRREMRSASIAPAASPSSFGPAIDAYRTLLDEGMPRKAARLFEGLLNGPLAPLDVFRVKVNLGLCYWLTDDRAEAARFIEEGCDAAPNEPKAIANRALVLLLRGKADEAFEYAKRELTKNPDNEWLASHLYRVALQQPKAEDPIGLIPPKLQKSEDVLLLRTLFLRNSEARPLWWGLAADASNRFPLNKTLALFAAEAVVDRNIYANLGRGRLTVSEPERPAVERSLTVLEASWERIKSSENPDSDEGSAILNTQMMARRLLGDRDGALGIARELIHRQVDAKLLTNAVQIAFTFEDTDLAGTGLAKLPAGGSNDYFRGMFAFDRGSWTEAAQHFRNAEYPEEDAALIDAIIRLAPAADPRNSIQVEELEALGVKDGSDPRVPVILATLARRRGFDDLAKRSFERALCMLGQDSGMPERIMVANYAEQVGEFGTVVDVLSGHVSTAILSAELQQLADAHAGEAPRKKRNLRFFEELTAEVRMATGVARAYATVLLDSRRYQEAERTFRQVIADRPDDAYSHLRLVETLQRQNNAAGAQAVVRAAKERLFLDQPSHAMRWAVMLREADEPVRALAMAYELVRKNPDSAKIALGYIGLIIGSGKFEAILDTKVCDPDCVVVLTSSRGERHEFIIDDGGSILGIEAVPRNSNRARRVLGSTIGAEFDEDGLQGQKSTWTLAALVSKYLHVLHVLMNQFQIRYPGAEGLRRLDVAVGDIKPILDMVRDRAESNRRVFSTFTSTRSFRSRWSEEHSGVTSFGWRSFSAIPSSTSRPASVCFRKETLVWR